MAVAAAPSARREPDLARARELAREANVIPIAHRFVDDVETPVSAFLKLRAAFGGSSFLLESAEQGGRLGRYSFLGFRPRFELHWSEGTLTELGDRGPARTEVADPYAAVAARLAEYRVAEPERLPPFAGGAVGYFGYDLVRTVERLPEPNPDDVGTPDMALMVSDALIVFDHLSHQVTILVNAFVEDPDDIDGAYEQAAGLIERARELLAEPVPRAPVPGTWPGDPADAFESNMTQTEYEAAVTRAKEYIFAGDAFQIVPSQRFSAPMGLDPFAVYRGLRTVNPSPYMFFLETDDATLVGSSPEMLVKVEGGSVEMHPIAGSRPRGADDGEDQRLGVELLADPKERAEHVMLVDLGRNDLGRVSEIGSVRVTELMDVRRYSHVMHIESSVVGRLAPGRRASDALRATFPAGTLSGAPKVRAMEIIDELEPTKRGPYGGAVGWLGWDGSLDTCITIRTIVCRDGVAHVQAGAGIVADSVPATEYEETQNKAAALFRAIEVAASQEDW
jgi:anthranilate synthase component I